MPKSPLLRIRNLHAAAGDTSILKGIDLEVHPGELHVVMGPNGAGKSTLVRALMGHPSVEVTRGSMTFSGKNVKKLAAHERAGLGMFLAFQYPQGIAGLTLKNLLRTALNAQRTARGEAPMDLPTLRKKLDGALKTLHLPADFLDRDVNVGLSGGEQKKAEILQMLLLEPALGILDEIDSGLDIDALKKVAHGIERSRTKKNALIVITHYQRLLTYLTPTKVHVLLGGKIVESGGPKLAARLEKNGYEGLGAEGPREERRKRKRA